MTLIFEMSLLHASSPEVNLCKSGVQQVKRDAMEVVKCEVMHLILWKADLWRSLWVWDPMCSVEFYIPEVNLNALMMVVPLEETDTLLATIYSYLQWHLCPSVLYVFVYDQCTICIICISIINKGVWIEVIKQRGIMWLYEVHTSVGQETAIAFHVCSWGNPWDYECRKLLNLQDKALQTSFFMC